MENKTKHVKIFVRIFPDIKNKHDSFKIDQNKRTIYIRSAHDFRKFAKNEENYYTFRTDGILFNINQMELYKTVTRHCIENTMNGNNILILSFGQVGTGKSFTINGLYNNYEQRGISPRLIQDLILLKNTTKDYDVQLYMSFIETRKSQLIDLFSNENQPERNRHLNKYKNVNVLNFNSEKEGLSLLFSGEGRRSVNEQAPYKTSHLYTSVLTLHVNFLSRILSNPYQLTSKIHLIDFAGIDSISKSTNEWRKSFDIGASNVTKFHLNNHLRLLQGCYNEDTIKLDRKNTVLEQYLGDSLSAKSIIRFIGHVSNKKNDLDITLSTLKFSDAFCRFPADKIATTLQFDHRYEADVLRKKLEQSTRELYLNTIFNENDLEFFITQARYERMEHMAKDFIEDKVSDIGLCNMAHIKTILGILKEAFKKVEYDKDKFVKNSYDLAYVEAVKNMKNKRGSELQSPSRAIKSKQLNNIKKFEDVSSSVSTIPLDFRKRTIGGNPKAINESDVKSSKKNIAKSKLGKQYLHSKLSLSSNIVEEDQQEKSILNEKPERLIDYEEAWLQFSVLQEQNKNSLIDIVNDLQVKMSDTKKFYNNEVMTLYEMRSYLRDAENNLEEILMQKHLTTGSEDLFINTLEKEAYDNVLKTKEELKIQQKKVTNYQNDIRNMNMNYLDKKKEVESMFQKFCSETYNMLVPILSDSKELKSDENLNYVSTVELSNTENEYKHLQKLMFHTAHGKKMQEYLKNRKWIAH